MTPFSDSTLVSSLLFVFKHVPLNFKRYLKNQKIETGGKIDIPQELLDNALEAEKEEKPTESE